MKIKIGRKKILWKIIKNIVNIVGNSLIKIVLFALNAGKQVEDLKSNDTPIIINNSASSSASASASVSTPIVVHGKAKNKWISLLLCVFTICGHKFYEGKFGLGLLYLFTAGLFGIGWIVDIVSLIGKPNPYYV